MAQVAQILFKNTSSSLFLVFYYYFIHMNICLHTCLCIKSTFGTCGGQKKALEFQAVLNYNVDAGIEPRHSRRAASALKCSATEEGRSLNSSYCGQHKHLS